MARIISMNINVVSKKRKEKKFTPVRHMWRIKLDLLQHIFFDWFLQLKFANFLGPRFECFAVSVCVCHCYYIMSIRIIWLLSGFNFFECATKWRDRDNEDYFVEQWRMEWIVNRIRSSPFSLAYEIGWWQRVHLSVVPIKDFIKFYLILQMWKF